MPYTHHITSAVNLNTGRQTVSRLVARMHVDGRLEKEVDQFVIPDRDSREYAKKYTQLLISKISFS